MFILDLLSGTNYTNTTRATSIHAAPYMRRISQGSAYVNNVKPLLSVGSSSQNDLRRLKCIGGESQGLIGARLGSGPSDKKITSFAQSVLALHKLQDNCGIHLNSSASKRNTTGSGSGFGLAECRVSY